MLLALNSTVYKADLQVTDMDRHYYQAHALTLAQHPSETDQRLMVRLLAFALHADDALVFAKDLNSDDEPALWRKQLTGDIDLWIEVGQPDEKRIRKACGRARQVVVYTYSGHGAQVWWKTVGPALERAKNVTVLDLDHASGAALTALAQRSMQLQCFVQDGHIQMMGGDVIVPIELATRTGSREQTLRL
jgi:uncharacterized protein YaeQ